MDRTILEIPNNKSHDVISSNLSNSARQRLQVLYPHASSAPGAIAMSY
jgi:hypothetical protein